MKPPFILVPDNISHETLEAAQEINRLATSGQAIGLIFGVMLRHRRYIVNSAGECHRNPTFALGMVSMLDAELRQLARP